MRSVKSYFNPTLYRKNLLRFWPIWASYSLIYLFALTLPILTGVINNVQHFPLQLLRSFSVPLAVLFGILGAMAVFSYLFSAPATGMMHSLPIRREGLFLTNYLSGLTFLWPPVFAVFLLSLAAEAVRGTVVFPSLFTWMVGTCLISLYFYSFGVLCAMFTGHILALPAFYLIFTVALPIMGGVLDYLFGYLLFGYVSLPFADQLLWLFPAYKLMGEFRLDWLDDLQIYQFYGLRFIFLYAIVALVLVLLALLLYQRRQLETAGDVVAVPWAKPIFKWGLALCCALAFSALLHTMFSSVMPEGGWPILVLMLICGLVGYFLGEMLLQKSFRVFRSSWRGAAGLLVCIVFLFTAADRDLFRFERSVPRLEQIDAVELHSYNISPYDLYFSPTREDPELIARVLDLHQTILDNHFQRGEEPVPTEGWSHSAYGNLNLESSKNTCVRITYQLDNGTLVKRDYRIPVTEALLADPDSSAARLSALANDPAVVEYVFFHNLSPDARLIDAYLSPYYDQDLVDDPYFVRDIPQDQLMDAILADIREGNLGRRYLLDNAARYEENYMCDLVLDFRQEVPKGSANIVHGYGHVAASDFVNSYNVTIGLQPSATHTLDLLARFSPDPDHFPLLTWAECEKKQ